MFVLLLRDPGATGIDGREDLTCQGSSAALNLNYCYPFTHPSYFIVDRNLLLSLNLECNSEA